MIWTCLNMHNFTWFLCKYFSWNPVSTDLLEWFIYIALYATCIEHSCLFWDILHCINVRLQKYFVSNIHSGSTLQYGQLHSLLYVRYHVTIGCRFKVTSWDKISELFAIGCLYSSLFKKKWKFWKWWFLAYHANSVLWEFSLHKPWICFKRL